MTCQHIGNAIVCGTSRRQRCACGYPATQLCDWKVAGKRSGTCDASICAQCAVSPATDKDLCPAHAKSFAAWRAAR